MWGPTDLHRQHNIQSKLKKKKKGGASIIEEHRI